MTPTEIPDFSAGRYERARRIYLEDRGTGSRPRKKRSAKINCQETVQAKGCEGPSTVGFGKSRWGPLPHANFREGRPDPLLEESGQE